MTRQIALTTAKRYVLIAAFLLAGGLLSGPLALAVQRIQTEHGSGVSLLALSAIVVVFTLGFIVYELARRTVLPSFVLAILFGIVSQDILRLVTGNPVALSTLITVGAALVLFGGGLDTPFAKFRSLLGPILSLALIGTLITAVLFGVMLFHASAGLGLPLGLAASVLLSAALASTDPAAIIPCLQTLHFKQPRVKHIAVSESAINDVVGAVLVSLLLLILSNGAHVGGVAATYARLLHWENLTLFLRGLVLGTGAGLTGFAILHWWSRIKASDKERREDSTDAALFLAVPLFCFTLAELVGGNGFLAVFIAGLLFQVQVHFRHIEHYFEHTIEGFMKPMIFMLLGSLVEPAELLAVAPLGLAAGVFFMAVLRPLTVFATLSPFVLSGKNRLSWKELVFLSFVRETGVIPAVLLITIQLHGIPGGDTMLAVGLWVILLTLVVQPPLTPLLAKQLHIAGDRTRLPRRQHHGPVAVLCSRGFSFPERMQTVVEWAQQHTVENIALLHCPEERYSPEFIAEVRKAATELFDSINDQLENEGKKPLNFEFLCGPGLLQDNIENLIASGDVSIIFVGSRMLDYRLDDVKRLEVPFFFMP